VGPGLELPLVREIQILRDDQAKSERRPCTFVRSACGSSTGALVLTPLVNRALDFAEGAEWLHQPLQALLAAWARVTGCYLKPNSAFWV
jgi:hypothetical protein